MALLIISSYIWLVKSTFHHASTFKPIPIVFEERTQSFFLSMNSTTALDQDLLVSQILEYGEKETEVENHLEPEKEEEPKQDQNFVGFETDEKVEEMIGEELGNKETEFEMLEAPETELIQQHGNMEIEDQSSLIPQANEIELEMFEVLQNDVQMIEIEESIEEANTKEFGTIEIEQQSPLIPQIPAVEPIEAIEFQAEETNIDPIDAEVTPQISELDTHSHSSEPEYASSIIDIETIESAIHDSEEKFAQNVWGISSVLLILIASTSFVYLRSKKASSTTTTTVEAPVVVKGLPSKKVVSSSSSLSGSGDSQDPYLERLSSQNWASSHVEMTGQSGPLEMSTSYQHSSSGNPRESERVSEAESQERKPMRNKDSFASPSQYSSSGLSPSYGSFTTYEKIHSKHGYGEDEAVTPVRRSSRIRKLVTSP